MNTTDVVGDMSVVVEVWFHSEGITNMLYIELIQKFYQGTYYSIIENTFIVWNEGKNNYR